MRLCFVTLLCALSLVRCNCDPPPPPPDAGQIGEGDPIDAPDGGDPYERDAGPIACEEDEHEDNDARGAAVLLASGATASGRFCGGDDDWYAIDVSAGCSVAAELSFDATGGRDLDMLMFDPDGQLVASAQTLGDREALNVRATKDGVYAVRIRGGARDDIAYDVTLTKTCALELSCPDDDRFEPNNAPQEATALTTGVAADGILCANNDDWFTVPVRGGCIADARVSFVHSNSGDIDLELYRADGTTRQAFSNSTTDGERLANVVLEGGMRYRLLLFGANAQQNTWRLLVNEVCAVACPADDPYEPNDSRTQAHRLSAQLDEALGVKCNNDDFFEVFPQAGCELTATLSFTHAQGDLGLELLSGGGTQLAISNGADNGEQIVFTPQNGNRLVLRVFGASNGYRLRVATTCP